MEARAGVITNVEVNGPLPTAGGGIGIKDLVHPKAPATWSLIWFLVALLFLFVI